ncbi:MAG: GNAT family N-acetyltransferase [Gammaproteobacteria bacterium]|nr:GNAT family N-acetyltransferase [Gammaproteobacteria bacterium]
MNDNRAVSTWISAMQQQTLIANWHADVQALVINDATLPVAVGCVKAGQTYLASPQHGFIDYARDECDQLSDASAQRWAKVGLSIVEPWFRALHLDESVSINAWGVSTHLYPGWSENTLTELKDRLVVEHPKRALWLRTLHEGYDAPLIEVAQKQGWQLWPSRVVYGFDWKISSQWMKQRNNQIDQKLLQKTTLTSLFPKDFNAYHAPEMAQLYQQLYVDKHSRWNAHYTPAYFQHAIEHQWLSFYGFADEQGQLIAFIGVFAQDGVMTTPMLGYDTSLPTELALYRLLMARVLRQSVEQRHYLNLGAGSANFKRMRGGVAHMEWHAFYAHHLPKRQSVAMKMTAKLMKRYLPSFLAQQAV